MFYFVTYAVDNACICNKGVTFVEVVTFSGVLTFAVDSAGVCKKFVTFSVLTFTGVLTFSGAAPVEGLRLEIFLLFESTAYMMGQRGLLTQPSFKVLDMPATLALSQQQWQIDNNLLKQHRPLGMTACALSKGLETMEQPLGEIARISETLSGTHYDFCMKL